MSLAEIKESAKLLNATELEELVSHGEFLRHTSDPSWRQEMLRRASSTSGWHAEEEVKALHDRLTAEGK